MARLACVDVPTLPLQLLIRSSPSWKDKPVAVVAEDRPTALIRYANDSARRFGVLPGQRYAAALALCRELRAGPVADEEARGLVDELSIRMHRFTPHVEPAAGLPGVFWLDAHGFRHLYPQLSTWAKAIRDDCAVAGVLARVVVGFSRFGSYAASRLVQETRIFESAAEEKAATRRVPLEHLDFETNVRDDLLKLGIRTLGEFLALPAEGLRERFGEKAEALHRLAAGRTFSPLVPKAPDELLFREEELGYPDSDSERLLFACKKLLDPLLGDLRIRSQALTALRLQLLLDNGSKRDETVRPAAPTLDAAQILNLLRLKLSTLTLSSGVVELRLEAQGERATAEQIRLSITRSRRDYDAMARAFARLRSEMGEDAVVRAVLREGHLPRSGFDWEPLQRLDPLGPCLRTVERRPLVRRIYDKPVSLPPRPRHEPDGWLLRGIEHGRVDRFIGPYVVCGGWWRTEVHRDYYFAWMSGGDVLWIYYDRRRQRWFLEGRVE
jgi:protein ImuB